MKQILIMLFVILITNSFAYSPNFLRQPTISPDGETICFVYMSDLWLAPYNGGEAKRITVTNAEDYRPIFSPDGKWIAFGSNRNGTNGIYLIPAEGGAAKMVTDEAYVSISDWYKDSEKLLGTKFTRGTGSGAYTINLDGRRIEEITPISHVFSKLSPNEDKIIFNINGYPYRPAYTGSVAGNLWEYDIKTGKYTQLTFTETTERYPLFSHVNPYIYYGGSDGERFQIFRVINKDFENPQQLTFFDDWSVRNISIARGNDRMVFEKFDKLWRYDPETEKAEEIDIIIRQDFLGNFKINESYKNAAQNMAVSPNNKLIAFSYKYDLFAMPEKGGEVKRITYDQKGIDDIVILPDNKTIYFLKRDRGSFQLFSVDINKPDDIVKNMWSEDKYIRHIYMISPRYMAIHYKIDEDNFKVALMDVTTNEMLNLIEKDPVWSWFLSITPDLDYAFYVTGVPQIWSRHLYLYDIEKKKSTRLLDSMEYIGCKYLGHDYQSLFMTMNNDLVRLDLVPKSGIVKDEDNWDEILEQKPEPKKVNKKNDEQKALKVEFEGLETRLHTISNRPGFNFVVHIISDSTLYYVNRNGNSYSLRKIDYLGKKDEEILSFNGSISGITTAFKYNEENNHFYVVVDNQIVKINPASKKKETINNEFDYEYNELELNKSVFDEIWAEFGNNFYDADMHGRDWNEMYDRFRPYVDSAYRMATFSNIIDEMIGELNASHTGFYPRSEGDSRQREIAFTGFSLDFGTVLDKGIKIRDIYIGSVAYQKYEIRSDDVLLSVDGVEITPQTTISSLFEDKVGKIIELTIKRNREINNIEIQGLTALEDYDLFYEDMVINRRDLTHQLSNNRLGYLHIPQMRQDKVQPFINDLFARNFDKEAVIIDIRGNSGGNISRELLDILTRQPRAYTTSRGYPEQKFQTPHLIWDKPMVLLIDQDSFSDAEIFPILFKQKGLGVIVGMPTSGGVIGTTPYDLMDGSSMRMPRTGWFTKEGINMEGTGAQPDYFIDLAPEDTIGNNDLQLKKAIEVLFNELDNN